MRVLGITPGLHGGVALLSDDGLLAEAMPLLKVDGKDHLDIGGLQGLITAWEPEVAIVERAPVMPKQGRSAAYSAGLHQGVLKGLLAGLWIPCLEVLPQQWKRSLQVSGEPDAVRMRATELFPSSATLWPRKKDLGVAEASLIAFYGCQEAL